jgi:hypothetical protein
MDVTGPPGGERGVEHRRKLVALISQLPGDELAAAREITPWRGTAPAHLCCADNLVPLGRVRSPLAQTAVERTEQVR